MIFELITFFLSLLVNLASNIGNHFVVIDLSFHIVGNKRANYKDRKVSYEIFVKFISRDMLREHDAKDS